MWVLIIFKPFLVCIHKPVTSRPANSERYLICKWKKVGTESAEKHLFSVNSMLWNNRTGDDDVVELVPLSVIQEDRGFYEYIYKSNCMYVNKLSYSIFKTNYTYSVKNYVKLTHTFFASVWVTPLTPLHYYQAVKEKKLESGLLNCVKEKFSSIYLNP